MAGSVNKAIIIGNLGRDPEIRSLNNGDRVASLRIATSETWRDKASGERKEKTEWHSVVVFNEHIVKTCESYLRKGSTVYVEGSLQTRKWTDQQGVEKFSTEIVIQRFNGELKLLGGKPQQSGEDFRSGGDEGISRRGGGGGHSDESRRHSGPKDSYDLNDDIPFVTAGGLI